jgi:hypothetical protein
MSAEPYYICRLLVKIDRDYQSEIIAFDIKDNPVVCYNTCIPVHNLQLIEIPKLRF